LGIEQEGYNVFECDISIPRARKLLLASGLWLRSTLPL